MKKILEVVTFPVGLLTTMIGLKVLYNLGDARLITLLMTALVLVSIGALVNPGLRRSNCNTKMASLGFGATVFFGWLFYLSYPMVDVASPRAWGKWGTFLGYVSEVPGQQMLAECIIESVVLMTLSLGVWMVYGLWRDGHSRQVIR